jgi:hypothetical protein
MDRRKSALAFADYNATCKDGNRYHVFVDGSAGL